MSLRIGIVGTGRFARRIASAIGATQGMTVSAVVSNSGDRAADLAKLVGGTPFTSITEAQQAGTLDAAFIANSNTGHASSAIEAIEAGLPTLCEKPFALSREEATRVLAAASDSGVLFVEDLWVLALPVVMQALAAAREGEIGELIHLYADFSLPTSKSRHGQLFEGPGAGALLDRGVYPISLAIATLGPVRSVMGNVIRQEGTDVAAALTLEHEGGGVAQVSCSLIAQGANAAILAGNRGRISILEPLLGAERYQVANHVDAAPADEAGGIKGKIKANPLARKAKAAIGSLMANVASYGPDQYRPMLEHFRDLVANGAKESGVVSHAISAETARVIEEARGL